MQSTKRRSLVYVTAGGVLALVLVAVLAMMGLPTLVSADMMRAPPATVDITMDNSVIPANPQEEVLVLPQSPFIGILVVITDASTSTSTANWNPIAITLESANDSGGRDIITISFAESQQLRQPTYQDESTTIAPSGSDTRTWVMITRPPIAGSFVDKGNAITIRAGHAEWTPGGTRAISAQLACNVCKGDPAFP